jgi:hypothetical protein
MVVITRIYDIKGLANVDKWWFYLTHKMNKIKWYIMPSLDGLIHQMFRRKGFLDVKTFQESWPLRIGQ